jgi:hypothetical protein
VSRRVARCVPEKYGRYRYLLEIDLRPDPRPGEADAGSRMAVILKNPSTAGLERSDPTAGRLEAWARRRAYGTLIIVNLFALRSTDPAGLNHHAYPRAVGPENDAFLRHAASTAGTLVLAWGNPNGIDRARYDRRIAEVLGILDGTPVCAVGSPTKLGYPRHGLWWQSA